MRIQRLLLQQTMLIPGVFPPPYDFPLQPHPAVSSAAVRHAANLDRYLSSPLHGPTIEAFSTTVEWLDLMDPVGSCALILDSGCGTGRSTRLAAISNPDALVIGVDRSTHRLDRGRDVLLPPNAWLVQAELASFWRLLLLAQEGKLAARVQRHQILYPNPYPKAKQRGKRWHCHPALPVALQLGNSLELRSNWLTYLVEFREAVHALAHSQCAAGVQPAVRRAAAAHLPARMSVLHLRDSDDALTLFEAKYAAKADGLYRLSLGGTHALLPHHFSTQQTPCTGIHPFKRIT